jgi:hypothetical protein
MDVQRPSGGREYVEEFNSPMEQPYTRGKIAPWLQRRAFACHPVITVMVQCRHGHVDMARDTLGRVLNLQYIEGYNPSMATSVDAT